MSSLSEFWGFVTTAEHWWGTRGILQRTQSHLWLSLVATVVAATVALPPALWLGHRRVGGAGVVALANAGRAIPSFAIIALVLPLSLRYGFGLGFWPTCAALVVLGIPPIFTNTYTGMAGTDPEVVEAARGMGMRDRQVVWSVEVPWATPLIITGLRISAVQIVATATLGALVGFQGLGSYIIEGLAQGRRGNDRLLTGAIAVAILAIVTEAVFSILERRLTPWTAARARKR